MTRCWKPRTRFASVAQRTYIVYVQSYVQLQVYLGQSGNNRDSRRIHLFLTRNRSTNEWKIWTKEKKLRRSAVVTQESIVVHVRGVHRELRVVAAKRAAHKRWIRAWAISRTKPSPGAVIIRKLYSYERVSSGRRWRLVFSDRSHIRDTHGYFPIAKSMSPDEYYCDASLSWIERSKSKS